ncbi:hypothetical protein LTR28_001824, partial [Elasticomyces elasticus]
MSPYIDPQQGIGRRRVDHHAGVDLDPGIAGEHQSSDYRPDIGRSLPSDYRRPPAPIGYPDSPAYPTEIYPRSSQYYMQDGYYIAAPGRPADQQRTGPTYPTGQGQYVFADPRHPPGYRDG